MNVKDAMAWDRISYVYRTCVKPKCQDCGRPALYEFKNRKLCGKHYREAWRKAKP